MATPFQRLNPSARRECIRPKPTPRKGRRGWKTQEIAKNRPGDGRKNGDRSKAREVRKTTRGRHPVPGIPASVGGASVRPVKRAPRPALAGPAVWQFGDGSAAAARPY